MSAYVIDKAALSGNIDICRKIMNGVKIYGVVKGDGYGLGLLPLSRVLRAQGVNALAITQSDDALALRNDGFDGELLMLRDTDDDGEIAQLLEARAIFTVGSMESFARAEAAAALKGETARGHLYVDLGMGREGFSVHDLEKLRFLCGGSGLLRITGLYTHFPAGQSAGDTRTRFASFMRLAKGLQASGWQGELHCASSCAAMRYPEMRLDAVRLGSAFLGRLPFYTKQTQGLQRIGFIETQIEATRWLEPGETVGYGAAFRARRKTRIGILDVGYYHGFGTERNVPVQNIKDYARTVLSPLRQLVRPKEKRAFVNGSSVDILGCVGMQNTVLDVTACRGKPHDTVILQCNPLLARNLDREYR